ncbi:hypothetical protein Dsin_026369 [Dipteronia sinensis]|uniref:CTLH domain-containing protein n=1 Tax=Dipteronia sinensis TaxID=43782 RepID=A0AAD9ZYK8_9ROSI|nr:hypothetical protein Dsin_026369 [Dipteronia sinensis]
MNHFGEAIMSGEWVKAEKYLSAFTKLTDNRHSKKLFFELHKQKYFEALDREDHALAINIIENELKLFSVVTLAELIALKDLRHDSISCTLQLSSYMNVTSTRAEFRDFLKQMIKRNPILQDKLEFPSVEESALLSLINLICPKNAKMTRKIKEELIYLILQFLDEENFKETLHKLELETKVYFDIDYVVECMINRKWDRAEKYLSAFTKMDDNRYSMDVFSRIQKQKHCEAVDRRSIHLTQKRVMNVMLPYSKCYWRKIPFCKRNSSSLGIDKSRLKKLIKQVMDWWIPHFAYMKHNASNQAISLKGIPTVPDLFHAPASVKIESTHEGGSSPALNGDGVPKNR